MKIAFDNSFKKDSSKIPKPILLKAKSLIHEIASTNNFQGHSKVKKIKGNSEHYRFKIGNYRIGCYLENQTLIFSRILHRKDIYKYFPKK